MILSPPGLDDSRGRAQACLRWSTAALLVLALAGCGAAAIEPLSVSNSALADKLLAHWPFDESGGTMVADRSGHGYNGVLTSDNPTWVTGRFGGGLSLKKSDSVAISGPSGFPDATADWTASAWIKMSEMDRMILTDQKERAVLLSTELPSMGGWEIEFDLKTGFDYLEASYYDMKDYPILNCRCIDIDRWMQFTVVFDWTNKRFHLYRDGLPVASAEMRSPISPGDSTLNIGRWTQGPRPISGVIDDFAIWQRALLPDEVAALNKRQVPDSP